MPENSRWDLIQRLKGKIVKNPGNERLNNLNDPVLNVLNNSKRIMYRGRAKKDWKYVMNHTL